MARLGSVIVVVCACQLLSMPAWSVVGSPLLDTNSFALDTALEFPLLVDVDVDASGDALEVIHEAAGESDGNGSTVVDALNDKLAADVIHPLPSQDTMSCMQSMIVSTGVGEVDAAWYEAILLSADVSAQDFVMGSRRSLRLVGLPIGLDLQRIVSGLKRKRCRAGQPCDADPLRVSCGGHGVCSRSNTSFEYTCVCDQDHSGSRCHQYDACQTLFGPRCQNTGVCRPSSNQAGYMCECPVGFFGAECQNVDHCARLPCLNGGSCANTDPSFGGPGFVCRCTSRYDGALCESRWRDVLMGRVSNNHRELMEAVTRLSTSLQGMLSDLHWSVNHMVFSRGSQESTSQDDYSLPALAPARK
eukprot:scpid52303/ scgid8526/ Protocadherin Fat 3; FAT tumor suppressor homolog 3